jgi:Tetratricopeptide repeat/Cytochrome c554 and c-prime
MRLWQLERWIRIAAIFALCSTAGAMDSLSTSTQSQKATPVREADAICSKCHQDIFRKYLGTPMANASGLASDRIFTGGFRHAPSGIDYRVSNKDGSLWLSYSRPGDLGLEGGQKLDYFLGSGHLGITYLYTINGYLLESPVAFYGQSQAYDMKPGLGDLRTLPSALPMTRGCMRCHMSGVQREDPGTRNHFQGLPFLHGGITCESCHGDTIAHVMNSGKAPVINPVKLDPERRDSVCISCHLEGDTRIEHAGREVDDYKPGERIADYLSYFVYAGDNMMSRAVSEIEELSLSKCKIVSGDRMSCMNCHDPHYSPPAEERAVFYRSKCLACHKAPDYSTSHFPDNPDCTSCHMPKGKVEKVPHVAWTDHRIRQNPDLLETSKLSPVDRELISFLSENTSQRDLALGYYDLQANTAQANRAWTQLLTAKKSNPHDLPVLTALGYLAEARGDRTLAMELYREALKLDPVDVTATNNLAILLAKSGQLTAAENLWQKTFDLNEDIDELGINLALAECMQGNKNAAQRVLQRVLLYSPDQQIARRKLQAIQSDQACAVPSLQ